MSQLIKTPVTNLTIDVQSELDVLDMNQIFQSATENLEEQIDKSRAMIRVAALPDIKGYKNEMIALVQHLLSNAIKRKKDGVSAIIMVTAEQNESEDIIHFRDNGIDLDEGVVLEDCQKIVDLHRGKMWATAQPGAGAIFSFSIPLT